MGKEIKLNHNGYSFSSLGIESYLQSDFLKAVEYFSKAIFYQPDNPNFYTWRGTAFEDIGQDQEASKDFLKTLEIKPTDFLASYRLGMVYYRKNDFDNAIKWLKISYDSAIKLTELGVDMSKNIGINNIFIVDTKIIANNLGSFLIQIGKYDESLKYIDKSIELDPNYHFAYLSKGLAYLQMNLEDKAIPFLIKAKKLGNPKADSILRELEKKNVIIQNPLNISDNPELSKYHSIPDITSVFVLELKNCYAIAQGDLKSMKEITEVYAVSMLISYNNNAKIVPMCIIDSILIQIFNASIQTSKLFNQNLLFESINELKTNVLKRAYKNSVREDVAALFG